MAMTIALGVTMKEKERPPKKDATPWRAAFMMKFVTTALEKAPNGQDATGKNGIKISILKTGDQTSISLQNTGCTTLTGPCFSLLHMRKMVTIGSAMTQFAGITVSNTEKLSTTEETTTALNTSLKSTSQESLQLMSTQEKTGTWAKISIGMTGAQTSTWTKTVGGTTTTCQSFSLSNGKRTVSPGCVMKNTFALTMTNTRKRSVSKSLAATNLKKP